MQLKSPPNLIFIGHKCSGKTYFGKRLAEQLGLQFMDTDHLIEQQQAASCREIAIKIGEKGFRALEKRVIAALDVSGAIIAVGGGAVLDAENCLRLQRLGNLVYLEVDRRIIKERILRGGVPSFLDPKDFDNSFEKMYQIRTPVYEKISAFKIQMD